MTFNLAPSLYASCMSNHPSGASDLPVIIVIDDDDAVRDSLAILLEAHGFDVRGFVSTEAYLAAPPSPALAVLADHNLPGMSGLELLQQLAAGTDCPRLGLISARMNAAMRARAAAVGAAAFDKPASTEGLLEWLGGSRRRDQPAS